MKRHRHVIAAIAALAVLYFFAGKFGLSLAFVNRSASAVWPPTGLSLAALLLGGRKLWPGVFAGAFLVNITTQGTWLTTLGIATGNTLEAVVAAALVERFAGSASAFERTVNVFKFFVLACVLSPALSATFGVTSLCMFGLAGWHQYGPVWITWWLGDSVSNLVIAPLLLIWVRSPPPVLTAKVRLEGSGLIACLLVTGWLLFVVPPSGEAGREPLEFLTIPPLLWAALRFGLRGGILSTFILSAIALWGTLDGRGPFSATDANQALLLLQGYIGTITLTMLVLASSAGERSRIEHRLKTRENISRLLAEAASVAEVRPRLLRLLCEMGGWDIAGLWRVNPERIELECIEMWHAPEASFPEFRKMSFEMRLSPGRSLPGRVWSTGVPAWIADVTSASNFTRAEVAAKDGVHAAVCCPVRLGDQTLGVIECFSRAVLVADAPFIAMMADVGRQYGQFLERKNAETALRESEERFRALADNIPQLAWMADQHGSIFWYNKRWFEFTGTTLDQMRGAAGGQQVHHPEYMQSVTGKFHKHLVSGETWEDIFPLRGAEGTYRWFLSRAFPIRDADGRITRWFGTNTDITELREAERALQEAREKLQAHAAELERAVAVRTAELRQTIAELESFSYSLSHDMRAPLRAMQSFTQLVLDENGAQIGVEGTGYLRKVVSAAKRMDRLIQDVLSLTRISRQQMQLEPIDLSALLREIIAERPEFQSPAAALELNEPLPRVVGHEASLTQCFTNILTNAVKFVAPGVKPMVRIWAERADQAVKICIQDNGIGIPQESQRRIFSIFERLHNEESYEGTGIGLTIVAKAVERMNGEVGLESAPGEGTRFWLKLPAA